MVTPSTGLLPGELPGRTLMTLSETFPPSELTMEDGDANGLEKTTFSSSEGASKTRSPLFLCFCLFVACGRLTLGKISAPFQSPCGCRPPPLSKEVTHSKPWEGLDPGAESSSPLSGKRPTLEAAFSDSSLPDLYTQKEV